MHVIAAKAVSFQRGAAARLQGLRAPRDRERPAPWPTRCWSAASTSSPAAPTTTCCWWTCATRASPARTRRRRSTAPGITVNKNTVPGETESPFVTSGIRIGTPALTTRGLGTAEMREIARLIDEVVAHARRRGGARARARRGPRDLRALPALRRVGEELTYGRLPVAYPRSAGSLARSGCGYYRGGRRLARGEPRPYSAGVNRPAPPRRYPRARGGVPSRPQDPMTDSRHRA